LGFEPDIPLQIATDEKYDRLTSIGLRFCGINALFGFLPLGNYGFVIDFHYIQ
jgi:hypothetical protein